MENKENKIVEIPATNGAEAEVNAEELLRMVNLRASEAVDAMNNGKSQNDIKEAKEIAKAALEKYNLHIKEEYYSYLMGAVDPLYTAILKRYIPAAKIKYKQNNKTGKMEFSVGDDAVKFDALDFFCKGGRECFANKGWSDITQKFAFVIANRINNDLSGGGRFEYAVSQAAREFNFAPDADPASVKSGTKALQACFDAILYVPMETKDGKEVNSLKALEKHYKYLEYCFTRQGKDAKSVILGGFTKVQELIVDAMYQVITKNDPRAMVE